jgi:DNA-binding GntR family transcriptional regulator
VALASLRQIWIQLSYVSCFASPPPLPSSALAQRLREAIDAGRWQPGDLLRQEQIAAEYGVSRIPVREALAQLQTRRPARRRALSRRAREPAAG